MWGSIVLILSITLQYQRPTEINSHEKKSTFSLYTFFWRGGSEKEYTLSALENVDISQSYCREKYTDLTSMRSLQEKEEIMKVTDRSTWWIGGYRDLWTWSDQSKSTLRKWAPDEPNGAGKEPCVVAFGDRWYDAPCNVQLSFICSGNQLIHAS
uniref:C-type lectin domain-containing protein n=1 Tax=Amphilophus citrinellus TaxID=61819 RepID=A0A3Q0RCJ4_AMPCI